MRSAQAARSNWPTSHVARGASREDVGSFALTISIFGVLLLLQHAAIATPYFVQQHASGGSEPDRAFAALISSAALCAVSLVLAAVLGVAHIFSPPVVLAVLVTAPALILKELVRDMDFAHLNLRRAIRLDVSAAFLQFLALACLYGTGALSAASVPSARRVAAHARSPERVNSVRHHRRWSIPEPGSIAERKHWGCDDSNHEGTCSRIRTLEDTCQLHGSHADVRHTAF